MESRSRKILDLVPKNVYKNNAHDHRTVVKEDIVEEAEQAECTSIRQADQPRRDSISSSSSSSSSDSSSGPSFYEDSDDSVKDPNYQIPTPISHKYLIKGHTQNEGDSAHSQIEKQVKRELRRGPMYSPDAFISAIKNARKKSEPFEVAELCYEDFYDWKNVCSQMSFVIQKDDENVPVKISDVKILKVMKDDARAIYFKNSYADEHFKRAVVIKKRKEIDIEVRKAYTTKPGISEKKRRI